MILPGPGDYIDIHTHGAMPDNDVFIVENLMAHENILPQTIARTVFTAGIHPWHLNEANHDKLISFVRTAAVSDNVIAVGEAGFDKLRGATMELQKKAFEEQLMIAEETGKPLVIHCVKAWDELLSAHRRLKASTPWLVHGFRGKRELAIQLLSRGMYISFWFSFALREESSELIRSLPAGRIFLETDGADADIRDIYAKVAIDLNVPVDELKRRLFLNFMELFVRE